MYLAASALVDLWCRRVPFRPLDCFASGDVTGGGVLPSKETSLGFIIGVEQFRDAKGVFPLLVAL